MPLWVVRFGPRENLGYNATFANPQSGLFQNFMERFASGVGEAYDSTPLGSAYVKSNVLDILNPSVVNATWDSGILFNFTASFVRGSRVRPSAAWRSLVEACMRNGYQLGTSNLFISPYQADPFSPCFRSDCHPRLALF